MHVRSAEMDKTENASRQCNILIRPFLLPPRISHWTRRCSFCATRARLEEFYDFGSRRRVSSSLDTEITRIKKWKCLPARTEEFRFCVAAAAVERYCKVR